MSQPSKTTLESLAEPVCRVHGVELVHIVAARDPKGGVIRVIIDREAPEGGEAVGSGVTLEDCQAVSRDLSVALDVHEEAAPSGPFRLEVSSPGLERPLVRLADYDRFAGREAKVRLRAPLNGRRQFQGVLRGATRAQHSSNQANAAEQSASAAVRIEQQGEIFELPFQDIGKAHLIYRF